MYFTAKQLSITRGCEQMKQRQRCHYVAEALGAKVEWIADTQQIIIEK